MASTLFATSLCNSTDNFTPRMFQTADPTDTKLNGVQQDNIQTSPPGMQRRCVPTLDSFLFRLRQCYRDKCLFAKTAGLSLRIQRLLWYCAFSLLIHSLATRMTHCIPVGCRMASGTMGDQNSFAVLWICTSAASFLL
jgi:hypothetical protein